MGGRPAGLPRPRRDTRRPPAWMPVSGRIALARKVPAGAHLVDAATSPPWHTGRAPIA
jgi:hypothetical protein